MTNLIGQSLGRYHILEQLGEGGMATVYKAYDTRLERNVAIKVIRRDVFAPAMLERMLKRFEREARALAKLSHPNIVKVLDYGEHEGSPYLVMEYLPGGTLKEKLAGGRLPWNVAVRLLLPIAQALAYAHGNTIIHRDIKPSNILITQSGEPMLSDFGIAKILEDETTTELTATGAGIGTPEYMAPEQGMGQADERADIYALGIVLYQMVTGHVPFRADTPMAILLKKNQEPLPRPKQFVPDLPDAVENALIKSLARNPANRYQAFSEVGSVFERLLRGDTTEVTVDEFEAPAKPNRKWIWIAAGLGGLLVTAFCIVGGIALASGLIGGGRAEPEPTLPPATVAPIIMSTPDIAQIQASAEALAWTMSAQTQAALPTSTQYIPPTAIPPTATSSLADPANFARWYFNAVWTDRNYEYLWNNCQTPSFQNHSTEGKGYSDYVNWWSSVQQADLQSVETLQNNGSYASIRVVISFHLNSGRLIGPYTYSYDLTWNSTTGIWMFDYR